MSNYQRKGRGANWYILRYFERRPNQAGSARLWHYEQAKETGSRPKTPRCEGREEDRDKQEGASALFGLSILEGGEGKNEGKCKKKGSGFKNELQAENEEKGP